REWLAALVALGAAVETVDPYGGSLHRERRLLLTADQRLEHEVITALVLLGQVLELRARSQTNAAIKMLLGLAPNTARIVRDDGTEEDIPLQHVQVGDTLRVR
ncbi:MAG: hypothetical protein ACLGHR_14010, partial [Gammaproteobacteria bacterium]